MKNPALVGVLLPALGLLSLLVPIPHPENRGVKLGDARIEIQTENSEKLPPAVEVVPLAGGVLILVLGSLDT